MVDVVADPRLQSGGDCGTAAPQLALWALGQVGPLDTQRWELVSGQGEQCGELRAPGRLGAVGGSIRDRQQRHLELAGLALLGGRVEDFLYHLGEGATDFEPFGADLQLATQLSPVPGGLDGLGPHGDTK
jgi:hypothetical protein